MNPKRESSGVAAPDDRRYATLKEVEDALSGLTDTDYAKLTMIAKFFCRRRRLSSSVIEPTDLLSEAVLKTLQCEEGKRWSKRVSFVRHLDRAMENISGHLVNERTKIVAFPDGLKPIQHGAPGEQTQRGPEDAVVENEKAQELLKAVFGQDDQAAQVFVMRVEDFGPADIQARLRIACNDYETINRRILRKIASFLNQAKH